VSDAPSILQNIIAEKRKKVDRSVLELPLEQVKQLARSQKPPREFVKALVSQGELGRPAVIAEIKKASPSQGIIREDFDPVAIAKNYENHGATCLSVLTDEPFFKGCDQYLEMARQSVQLPVLRKDFIIDPYQIFESRALGADCILLIAAVLDESELFSMTQLAMGLGMGVLVEVHSQSELEKLSKLPEGFMLGINNRDLHTFNVSLDTSVQVKAQWSKVGEKREALIVSESGIHTEKDIHYLRDAGINTFLIGESFMRADDPGQALHELFNKEH